MYSSVILYSLDNAVKANRIHELLAANEELQKYGLVLMPSDAEEIIAARKHVLEHYGRIELDLNVTKTLINRIAMSHYINQDNYLETVNDMYEIFHVVKNASSDLVCDEEIINAIMVYYDKVCGGSTALVLGKGIEKMLNNYRNGRNMADILREEDEKYWSLSE